MGKREALLARIKQVIEKELPEGVTFGHLDPFDGHFGFGFYVQWPDEVKRGKTQRPEPNGKHVRIYVPHALMDRLLAMPHADDRERLLEEIRSWLAWKLDQRDPQSRYDPWIIKVTLQLADS